MTAEKTSETKGYPGLKNTARPKKKETLEDILSAVKEKEDVLRPFTPDKPKPVKQPTRIIDDLGEISTPSETVAEPKTITIPKQVVSKPVKEKPASLAPTSNLDKMAEYFAHPLKYLFLRFGAGFFFVLGIATAIAVLGLIALGMQDLSIFKLLLKKSILLMRSLVKK